MRVSTLYAGVLRLSLVGAGVVLVFSGALKGAEPERTAAVLEQHGLISSHYASIASFGVAMAEVLIGLAAMIGAVASRAAATGAALGVALVGLVFSGYALVLVVRPPPAPGTCGCPFGGQEADWPSLATRNGLITVWYAALATAGFLQPRRVDS